MTSTDVVSGCSLLLVAKYPYPGKCKTRLYPAIGSVKASQLAQALLIDCLCKYHSFGKMGDMDINPILLYAPQTARLDFEEFLRSHSLQNIWRIAPQTGQLAVDLGDKLKAALEMERSRGASVVGFIGMDCPELSKQDILFGVQFVASTDRSIYLIPSADGGYVFICLPSNTPPAVFDDISWSSTTTLESQVQAIHRVGYHAKVYETMSFDLDKWTDVQDLYKRSRSPGRHPEEEFPHTWELLKKLEYNHFFTNH